MAHDGATGSMAHAMARSWTNGAKKIPLIVHNRGLAKTPKGVLAVLAGLTRAGYSLVAGIAGYERMARTPQGIAHTRSGGVTHPTWPERIRLIDRVDRALRGQAVKAESARLFCASR